MSVKATCLVGLAVHERQTHPAVLRPGWRLQWQGGRHTAPRRTTAGGRTEQRYGGVAGTDLFGDHERSQQERRGREDRFKFYELPDHLRLAAAG